MSVLTRIPSAVCAAALISLLASATTSAAPVTVNLRVEGSSRTLFEGPVSTEAIPSLSTEATGGTPYPCDVAHNGSNGGSVPAGPSATAALYDATRSSGLAFNAEWSSSYNDFLITQVGPDVDGGPPEYPSWGYAVNYTTANVGGCQFQLAAGSEVLWAYNYFNLTHLLSLSGPAIANIDTPFTVHVVDGQTGAPLAGATIGEDVAGVTTPIPGALTDAGGNATVTLGHAGEVTLKASRAESVRSNGVAVCVHNGNDGTCGTTVPGPVSIVPRLPVPIDDALVTGIRYGHVYPRRRGPRELSGEVRVPAGGTLHQVRISLARRSGRHCFTFDGARAAFRRARCGARSFFSVGGAESFSYLLPARLPAGLYVYEVQAVDDGGNTTRLVDGVSDVSFRVR